MCLQEVIYIVRRIQHRVIHLTGVPLMRCIYEVPSRVVYCGESCGVGCGAIPQAISLCGLGYKHDTEALMQGSSMCVDTKDLKVFRPLVHTILEEVMI